MRQIRISVLAIASVVLGLSSSISAQNSDGHGVSLSGSLQSDMLFPQEDQSIGTGTYDADFLSNTFLDLTLQSKFITAGARLELLNNPLPGFEYDEGNKYYIRDIKFIGNTVYDRDFLLRYLQMNSGDVYNQTKLEERLFTPNEDGLQTLYMDKGYLFLDMVPVETNIQNDSIDLEIRIVEGPPATINKVRIEGNDRLYEHVVRRELRTKPGQLFSKSDLIRSQRELAQTGHFDPETMNIQPIPNYETSTVDLLYGLTSKANDQIEFSAGWGQTGIIGKLSLRFTNFSIKNLFNPSSYKGIIPQGYLRLLPATAFPA